MQLKQSTTKVVDVKEVLRVDSILAGIMRKVISHRRVMFMDYSNRRIKTIHVNFTLSYFVSGPT